MRMRFDCFADSCRRSRWRRRCRRSRKASSSSTARRRRSGAGRWCTAFEKATGIKVLMTRKSSGEFYAQIKAEAANPKGDIWWGGTGDPHLQAAEEGLTEPYKSPKMGEQQDWAVRQWEASKGRTVGVYAGALGYSYNTDQLKKKNIPTPKCWADLTKPAFKDEIQVANPNSSGTSYTMLATFVQLMGEDKAFEYMKALHKNVNQYTKSGAAPARAAATGESLVGITFQHDAVVQAVNGANVTIVSPCEGTGYEIGSMSIIKGAKNMENAKKWYDWALTPEAQSIARQRRRSASRCRRTRPRPCRRSRRSSATSSSSTTTSRSTARRPSATAC